MIGAPIADPITDTTTADPADPPSGRPEAPPPAAPAGSHGVMEQDGDSPTRGGAAVSPRVGGGVAPSTPAPAPAAPTPAPAARPAPALPASESTRLLQASGVRRSVAASLGDRPAALVAHVIAQARARAEVRDLAGWVVAALRDLPDDAAPAPPAPPLSALPIHTHPDLTDEQRDRWIYRFRAAPTPVAQRAILEQLAQEHPLAGP